MEADVRSIDAVRDWHAALAGYGEILAEALAGVELEIRRANEWLDEQRERWRRAIRECEEEVTRAKAELSQRKLPTWDGREPDCTVQERNLRRAKARLEHAEDQVERCRQWIGRLPKLIDENYTGSSRRLSNLMEADLPKWLADLSRRIAALEAYAGERLDYAPAPSSNTVDPTPSPAPGSNANDATTPGSESPSGDKP